MKLADLTWQPYSLPLRAAFRSAHGSLVQRTGALVWVTTAEGVRGCGEIAPLPGQGRTDLDGVLALLEPLARALKGRTLADILAFLHCGSAQEQWPSSLVCGLEIALFDALGRASGQTMAALLAACAPDPCAQSLPRAHVSVNAVIGGATIEQMVAQARAALAAGFSCLKVKLTGAWQEMLTCVQTLRSVCGPGVDLRLDANEGWSFEQASQFLACCAACAIEYVEQPLPAGDLALMARLRAHSPVPLAADEALTGLEGALQVLEAGAADVLILKPQLAGGLQICRQIVEQASRRGVACVLTSNLEAGPGVVATLHLAAALPRVTLPCGLATLDLLEDDLLLSGLVIAQGQMLVPTGPGLGVALKCEEAGGLL
ncbi:MAG TPA: o-succinylbenzoate synthase [Ktedonobacteraceae bacterium]|jgi:o-succinylbenzoate synthase